MGLLDTISKGIGSVFGGSSGPSRQVAELDDETNKLIDTQIERSKETPELMAQKENDSMQGYANQFASPSESNFNPAISDAIRSNYQQITNQDLDRMSKQNEMQAHVDKSNKMRQAFTYHMARRNIAAQNFQRLADANAKSEMMRAQILGEILGGAGRGVGMYLGAKAKTPQKPDYGSAPMFDPNSGQGPEVF